MRPGGDRRFIVDLQASQKLVSPDIDHSALQIHLPQHKMCLRAVREKARGLEESVESVVFFSGVVVVPSESQPVVERDRIGSGRDRPQQNRKEDSCKEKYPQGTENEETNLGIAAGSSCRGESFRGAYIN